MITKENPVANPTSTFTLAAHKWWRLKKTRWKRVCWISGVGGLLGETVGTHVGTSGGAEKLGGDDGPTMGGQDSGSVGGKAGAKVLISTFIPWLQWPLVAQMKYRFPAELRCVDVLPPVYF